MPRLLDKLEYLANTIWLLDQAKHESDAVKQDHLMQGGKGYAVDWDFNSLRTYLLPEVRLLVGSYSGIRDGANSFPLIAAVPELGINLRVSDSNGLDSVKALIAELRADDSSEIRQALGLLTREIARKTTGNDLQKGKRLLKQLEELLVE